MADTSTTLAAKSDTLSQQVADSSKTLAAKSDELDKKLSSKTDVIGTKTDTIAKNTEALRDEIRTTRPLAPNNLFSEYLSNRVVSSVYASRPGLIGTREKERSGNSVLITDGTNTFALLHVDDTPLGFSIPGFDWDRLLITLRHDLMVVPGSELRFWVSDPRVVLIPVSPALHKTLGVKPYAIATDPSKFQEAVLVGARDDYYGECRFQLQTDHPGYVRMDRNLFKRLSGNFAPSKGDLVFSKGGQVIGIMVNKQYCALVNSFRPMYTLRAGMSETLPNTANILAAMQMWIERLPLTLQ